MKKILFASSCIPESIYNEYVVNLSDQQAQKFNRLMIKGFLCNNFSVECISYLSDINLKENIRISKEKCNYYIISPNYNHFKVIVESYVFANDFFKNNNDSILVCNILNISVVLGCIIAAKKNKKRIIGFVTDLPLFMYGKKSIYKYVDDYIIKKCDDFILLTDEMANAIKVCNRKYTVIEGLSDYAKKNEKIEVRDNCNDEKFIMSYIGSLHKCYGVDLLVKAFLSIDNKDVELHIYGKGDYETEIFEYSRKYSNIKYFGTIVNSEALFIEKNVDLLINPRTRDGEYTKYSFPSKIIEYMSSGTPVVMNMLPGIPKEYKDYCICFKDETVTGYADTLKEILMMDKTKLNDIGKKAQKFVNEQKNCKKQINKVINELEI